MKKVLSILAILILLIAAGVGYFLSGAGEFIRSQIEQQGSKYLGSTVSVFNVDLALREGRMTIQDLQLANPEGFSTENAFKVDEITLDLGAVTKEPYVVQTISIQAPEILYEVDASGQGNLLMLKKHLTANMPKSQSTPKDSDNPLLIVENLTVSEVRLKLNFEKLATGDFNIKTKAYEVTLPTFNAGPIGQPNGMPADQVGAEVLNVMLDTVITAAKTEAKKRLAEMAKKKAKEELDKQKDKLLEKANDKLKNLFN